MTTKDWLNRGWALDREITALESAKRRAYDRCVSGVASVSGAPGGGGASDGGLSRYADFAAQVDAQIDKLIDIKQEIAAVIAEVPDTTLRTLSRAYDRVFGGHALARADRAFSAELRETAGLLPPRGSSRGGRNQWIT